MKLFAHSLNRLLAVHACLAFRKSIQALHHEIGEQLIAFLASRQADHQVENSIVQIVQIFVGVLVELFKETLYVFEAVEDDQMIDHAGEQQRRRKENARTQIVKVLEHQFGGRRFGQRNEEGFAAEREQRLDDEIHFKIHFKALTSHKLTRCCSP